jgi:hypothetical protein
VIVQVVVVVVECHTSFGLQCSSTGSEQVAKDCCSCSNCSITIECSAQLIDLSSEFDAFLYRCCCSCRVSMTIKYIASGVILPSLSLSLYTPGTRTPPPMISTCRAVQSCGVRLAATNALATVSCTRSRIGTQSASIVARFNGSRTSISSRLSTSINASLTVLSTFLAFSAPAINRALDRTFESTSSPLLLWPVQALSDDCARRMAFAVFHTFRISDTCLTISNVKWNPPTVSCAVPMTFIPPLRYSTNDALRNWLPMSTNNTCFFASSAASAANNDESRHIPKYTAAAVVSLMIAMVYTDIARTLTVTHVSIPDVAALLLVHTSSPAINAASTIAARWLALNANGTVSTQLDGTKRVSDFQYNYQFVHQHITPWQ